MEIGKEASASGCASAWGATLIRLPVATRQNQILIRNQTGDGQHCEDSLVCLSDWQLFNLRRNCRLCLLLLSLFSSSSFCLSFSLLCFNFAVLFLLRFLLLLFVLPLLDSPVPCRLQATSACSHRTLRCLFYWPPFAPLPPLPPASPASAYSSLTNSVRSASVGDRHVGNVSRPVVSGQFQLESSTCSAPLPAASLFLFLLLCSSLSSLLSFVSLRPVE